MPKKTESQRPGGTRKTSDLAPGNKSLKNEAIPKSVARVLNAQQIRDSYRRKRKLDDVQGRAESNKRRKQQIASQDDGKVSLVIQPGESLQHFNRRVEDDLRPLVKTAMQMARAIERNAARHERVDRATGSKSKDAGSKRIENVDELRPEHNCDEDVSQAPPPSPKEFATAIPKRLNDVAQEPPDFKKFPRGASSFSSKKVDVLPMSQKLLMEKERESAIQRYRELRASQRIPMDHK